MRQFFEDCAGALSMSRLCLFGAFIVASLFLLLNSENVTEAMFVAYLASFVAGYGAGKYADRPNKK